MFTQRQFLGAVMQVVNNLAQLGRSEFKGSHTVGDGLRRRVGLQEEIGDFLVISESRQAVE
jgi:hypothetical protein